MKRKIVSLLLTVVLVLGLLPMVSADWGNFRGSAENMAITTAPVPTDPSQTAEKWSTAESLSSGSGWDINNPSPMLLVNGKLITTCGEELLELDRETGDILRRTLMASTCGTMGNSAPAYGNGMIFMPLQDGRVQAFDAATLEAVWISETLGSQCTTGLVYEGGFVFGCTGMGNGSVFSLPAADADATMCQVNTAVWNLYAVGDEQGSYFSTPIVTETAVVYGTDSGYLCSRDRSDGSLLSRLQLPDGKQRSGIALYEGRVYGGTSAGYLFSAALEADGTLTDLKAEKDGGSAAISSTPVIYNGVVYYGGNKTVIAADAATLKTLRTSGTTGFEQEPSFGGAVQSSLLLYPGEDAVYLYATQNCPPGGLYVIRDDGTAMTAQVLHMPAAEKQEYCLVSPICDENGTIYYRNDSGYFFAVSKKTPAPQPPTPATVTATVSVVDHRGAPVYAETAKQMPEGATAYDILLQTGLEIDAVSSEYGMYVRGIGTLKEKTEGDLCYWMYEVNGQMPMVGASSYVLQSGDKVCWRYYAEVPAEQVFPGAVAVPREEEKEEAVPVKFADTATHWAKEAIAMAAEEGFMQGVSETEFAPERAVTRNMVMTVLARMEGIDTEGGANWYEKAMVWAMAQGITDGSNAEGIITRQQLVTMLYRYAGSPAVSGDLTGYTDAAEVSQYAGKAMVWAVENGIITGMTETTLGAMGETTRAQLAVILMRFAEVRK